MSDTDEVTVTPELRDRLTGLAMSAPPPLESILARGRSRRRRRRVVRAGVCLVGSGAAVALALGFSGVVGSGAAPATGRAAAPPVVRTGGSPVVIRTAAYSIVSNRDGTVTLTINPSELFDATTLQNDLAQFGIPALVTIDKVCTSDPAPADISQVESYNPGAPGEDATVTIDPTAMPAGSEISFGTVEINGGVRASYSSLVDSSAYSCTSTPPTDAQQTPSRDGYFELDPAS